MYSLPGNSLNMTDLLTYLHDWVAILIHYAGQRPLVLVIITAVCVSVIMRVAVMMVTVGDYWPINLLNTEPTDVTANWKQMVNSHTNQKTSSSSRAHAIDVDFGNKIFNISSPCAAIDWLTALLCTVGRPPNSNVGRQRKFTVPKRNLLCHLAAVTMQWGYSGSVSIQSYKKKSSQSKSTK